MTKLDVARDLMALGFAVSAAGFLLSVVARVLGS